MYNHVGPAHPWPFSLTNTSARKALANNKLFKIKRIQIKDTF